MVTQQLEKRLGVKIHHPFTFDEDIFEPDTPEDLRGAFVRNPVTFTDMDMVTQAATYFKENGHYLFPPPKPKDSKDKTYYKRFKNSKHYAAHKAWWDREENRRRNGLVVPNGIDEDGKKIYVFITGKHYGYMNYQVLLRDATAGVDESILDKDEDSDLIIPKFAKKTGESTKDFPDFWDGDYYYFHAIALGVALGLHLVVNKCRQVGFSYKNAWVATDELDLYPNGTTVIGAFDYKYLNDGDATMNMSKNNMAFLNEFTDWKKGILTNNATELKLGYSYQGGKDHYGYQSKILAVSFGPANDGAARGKKGRMFIFEEAGKFPNLIKSVVATEKSLREGSVGTGNMIVFGTGGGEDTNWEGFEKIFYNPVAFGFLPFQNIWDEGMENSACGFFHPRYQNLKPCYDENGNSDIPRAKRFIEKERETWRAGGDELYNTNVSEYPVSPSESFLRGITNIFTCSELTDHFREVTISPKYKFGDDGVISHTSSGLKFIHNKMLKNPHPPIMDYPHKKNQDVTGCVTIWQYPYTNNIGAIPKKLYYVVHDPYATDKNAKEISVKNSLGAAYVYEAINNFTPTRGDRLVAKYVGRPEQTDDYNKQLFNLTKYYNATLWFENDRGDVQGYAKRFKMLELLNLEPDFDDLKELAGKQGRRYGVSMGAVGGRRKQAAAKYTKDWLTAVQSKADIIVDEEDEIIDGEIVSRDTSDLLTLHYINDPRLLKELIKWQMNGNFDCVSAIFVLMMCIKEIESKNEYATDVVTPPEESFLNADTILNNY